MSKPVFRETLENISKCGLLKMLPRVLSVNTSRIMFYLYSPCAYNKRLYTPYPKYIYFTQNAYSSSCNYARPSGHRIN